MGVVLSLGPVLGPVLGGLVLDSAGWRALFFINIPIGAVAAVLSWRLIQRDAPADLGSAGRLDLVGVLLLVPGLAGMMLGFTQIGETNTVVAWQVLVPLVLGAALLGGYVLHAVHARRVMPLIDLRMFATTGFSPSVVVQGLVGTGTFSVLFALPLYYQLLHGFSPSTARLLVAPLGAGAALAMPIAGRLSDRLGAKRLVQGGGTLALLATLALTQIGGGPGIGTAIAAGVAAFAVGVGLGFVGAPTIGSLYRILPPQQVPQGSSVLYTLNQLGAGIGIATVAVLVSTAGANDPLTGLHALYWFTFAAIVIILICSPRLPGRPIPAGEGST
ncbi:MULTISPECIES: MFS transporter [unclassified Pseudonocardia]|uniref:MFS transporter n=1 Tax=unclassified Pseudonocardia TaxID=2619320 RepID=UPI001C375699|nr:MULTISPECIES: MFS transporter [unclassified Pseudonocardia]